MPVTRVGVRWGVVVTGCSLTCCSLEGGYGVKSKEWPIEEFVKVRKLEIDIRIASGLWNWCFW